MSLSDTASILKTYTSNIDQHHHEVPSLDADDNDDDEIAASTEDGAEKAKTPRKSREDWEAEALIAQMDALVNNKSSTGMMSDDVYERLKMITKSICAEVDGVPLSASGMAAGSKSSKHKDLAAEEAEEEQPNDNGAGAFLAQLEEAERLEQQQKTVGETKREKKKEKKAKKSAKKAKKDAKRKAKEIEDGADGADLKKTKVES